MQNIVPMQSRQSIELRHHQRLALTPQVQQSIRFLQLSAQDLEQEVARALADNPLLERDEEYDTEVAPTEPVSLQAPLDEPPVLTLPNRSASSEDGDFAPFEGSSVQTLSQHLLTQLHLTRATARDCALATLIIDEIDENGYFLTGVDEIARYLPVDLAVSLDELEGALRLVQSFHPAGVGARSLSDCLLLQLKQISLQVDADVLACARDLAQHHLDLLAGGNLVRLREVLSCSQDRLRQAHALLLQLDPKPGRGWALSVADYVVPEVIVRKVRDRWLAHINPAVMPRLRVNQLYERLIKNDKTAVIALQQQAQQAHGLVRSVAQRFETILRVAQSIVERQQDFFSLGVKAMHPLLLRDIAQELDMHESTVSRATKLKYMQTPWGVFELKRFFGTALTADNGQVTSATAVRSLIQKLVDQESAKKPLSDSQIKTRLAEKGVIIARRTVAKYREAAGIKTASLRKAKAQLDSDM